MFNEILDYEAVVFNVCEVLSHSQKVLELFWIQSSSEFPELAFQGQISSQRSKSEDPLETTPFCTLASAGLRWKAKTGRPKQDNLLG